MTGFADAAAGSLLLAVPVALLAGLVSFLSPCVLPLVPGYLSYVTGLSGADLQSDERTREARGRMVLGAILFVAGFALVFVSGGLLFGGLGAFFLRYEDVLLRVLGVITIVLGLAFTGLIPWLQRDVRMHRVRSVGLASAPVLGITFGLGWTPCMGPTLGVVATLATTQGTAVRGALLMLVYAFGLGLPFVLAALAFRRMLRAFSFVRRHQAWVTRIGGGMLILVGLLLVTGVWGALIGVMRQWASGFTTAV